MILIIFYCFLTIYLYIYNNNNNNNNNNIYKTLRKYLTEGGSGGSGG